MANKVYTVKYRLYIADDEHFVDVLARNKEEAYDIAVYDKIPAETGEYAYSAWVHSVTYQNGNYKRFKTFEGKPY